MAYTPVLAGQRVTAELLNTAIVEETMAWTDLSAIGAFGGVFSAGIPVPRMRKIVNAGTVEWHFEGRINASSFAANAGHTAFTFNTGYRVAAEVGVEVYGAGSSYNPIRLGFMTNGTLIAGVPTAGGSGTSAIWLTGVRITNPLG